MKIGILSDIHVDINASGGMDRVTPQLCSFISEQQLDLFITAGDIASNYLLTLKAVEELEKNTGIPCLFVPGNHDIWTEHHPAMTSWDIYRELQKHPHNLASGPYDIDNNYTVVGDLGWYDYRFGSSSCTVHEYDRMQYDGRVWQDSIMARWDRSTLDMHSYFLEKIEKQLSEVKDKNIILVTHVLPIEEFTVQNPPPLWQYLNAFMGSPEYGKLTEKYPSVKYSISGHVHYRKKQIKHGTTFICSCLGYASEWAGTTDPAVEIPKAVTIIEI